MENDAIHLNLSGIANSILPVYRKHLFDYDYVTNVYYGSASSGKSYFIAQKLIIKALQDARTILVIRKVGTSIRDSVWRVFKGLIQALPEEAYKINKSEFTITLANGSEFIFKGLDDPEKIKSIADVSDIFIEEATEITSDDFDQLTLRLRGKNLYKQIYLAFNPISKANWVYKRFFDPDSRKKLKSTRIIRTTYKDNPTLDRIQIDAIENLIHTNGNYYKVYALGQFATLDKLIFPTYQVKQFSDDDIVDFNKRAGKSIFKWAGLDFGFTNDPTAITWGYYEPLKPISNLYITGEYQDTGLTNDKIAKVLKSLLPRDIVIADSAEQKSIKEIQDFGFRGIRPSRKGQGSILLGIDRISRCNIIISKSCLNVIDEFDNYTWKKDKKTGEYINEPIDAYNHHADSIRYGIQPVIDKKYHSPEELARAASYLYG